TTSTRKFSPLCVRFATARSKSRSTTHAWSKSSARKSADSKTSRRRSQGPEGADADQTTGSADTPTNPGLTGQPEAAMKEIHIDAKTMVVRGRGRSRDISPYGGSRQSRVGLGFERGAETRGPRT